MMIKFLTFIVFNRVEANTMTKRLLLNGVESFATIRIESVLLKI